MPGRCTAGDMRDTGIERSEDEQKPIVALQGDRAIGSEDLSEQRAVGADVDVGAVLPPGIRPYGERSCFCSNSAANGGNSVTRTTMIA